MNVDRRIRVTSLAQMRRPNPHFRPCVRCGMRIPRERGGREPRLLCTDCRSVERLAQQ